MHEVGLINGLLDQLQEHLGCDQLQTVVQVNVRVGCSSGIDGHAMAFAFEAARMVHPHLRDDVRLNIIKVDSRMYCADCQAEWTSSDPRAPCPRCGGYICVARGGGELTLDSVELADV